jgi:hypothetical protein
MQKIESAVDELHAALAIGGRLGVGEARQSGVVDAAELAVEIGGLHVHVGERRDGAWIFRGPVEARSGQELHTASIDACGHAIAVELDLVDPCGPAGGFSTGCESWKGTNCGRGESRCDRPGLMACEAVRLTTRGIAGTQSELPDPNAVISNKVLFLTHP